MAKQAKMIAQEWSMSALSVELGLDRRTLGKILEGVEPCGGDGRGPKWRLRDVVAKMVGSGELDATQERARKDKALADKTELQVAEMARRLLPADEVSQIWGDHITACRAKLMAMPSTLAPQVAIEDSVPKCRKLIDRNVREALAELQEMAGERDDDS